MRRPGGFTLVEGLIVCTLLLGMMSLVAAFFTRGQRYTVETNNYAWVQREANQILRKVADDLYRSTGQHSQSAASSVAFLSYGPTAPGQPAMEMKNPGGQILWKKWIGYYLDNDSHTLYRTEVPLDTPTSDLLAAPVPVANDVYLRSEPGLQRRPCGHGVMSFSATRVSVRRFRVSLAAEGAAELSGLNAQQRKIRVDVSTDISVLDS